MERISMSQAERDRLEWLKRARDGLVTQRQAAEKMGISDRQVRQLPRGSGKAGRRSSSARTAREALEPKDRRANPAESAERTEAGGVTRLRADIRQ